MEHLVVVLLFLSASVHLSTQADTHTLLYVHTSSSPRTDGPEFTAAVCVDGEEVVYYDSNIIEAIPKTKWIKKIEADYWKRETQRQEREHDKLKPNLEAVMQSFRQTEGDHTLQRMYSCECCDDGITRGLVQYCYDGEDFLSLNLTTGNWTAVKPEAESFIKTLESTGHGAKHWKSQIDNECKVWLNEFVSYGRENLKRKGDKHNETCQQTCGVQHSGFNETLIKDEPKGGGSGGGSHAVLIGVIVAIVIAGIVVVGLVIRKKGIPGFRPVPQNSNS